MTTSVTLPRNSETTLIGSPLSNRVELVVLESHFQSEGCHYMRQPVDLSLKKNVILPRTGEIYPFTLGLKHGRNAKR